MRTLFIALSLIVFGCNGLIVPGEVQSVLMLYLTNFGVIKKGTDSRIGFGFRLGKHVDFQTLIDIGPQYNTKPIGNAPDAGESDTSKRMTNPSNYGKVIKTAKPKLSGIRYVQKSANEIKPKIVQTRKPRIIPVENGPLKASFTAKDQYLLPKLAVDSDSSLRQLHQLMYAKQSDLTTESQLAIGEFPAKKMETHILLAARENAATLQKERKIKADSSDISLDN